MLNLHLDISTISSVTALAHRSSDAAQNAGSQASTALKEPPLPVATLRLPNNNAALALKASQSRGAMLQSLGDKMLGMEGLLHQVREGGAAPQANGAVAKMKDVMTSDQAAFLSNQSRWTSALDSALVQMEDALDSLGAAFADSVSPMSAPNANSSAGGTVAGNADGLSAALQSVSEAKSVIEASADSLYQSSLDTVEYKLIEHIDNASGSLDFNIEQTLIQAGNDVLRDRSTISALVPYLLQP